MFRIEFYAQLRVKETASPPIAVIIPIYLLWSMLGLLDTQIGLIIAYVTFNLPIVVWLMKGFFDEMPKEIEEAALVDGCSRVHAFLRIAIPLAAVGFAARAFVFLGSHVHKNIPCYRQCDGSTDSWHFHEYQKLAS